MLAIDRFREKYGLTGHLEDMADLRAIGAAFSHLPYENVTKILKHARSTGSTSKLRMAEEVLEDHLRWNAGGTCFSLCNALLSILENCNYSAFIAMADMHYGPNIHCAVVVSLAGKGTNRYLFDPGYLLNVPLLLPDHQSESIARTPMNEVVLRKEDTDVFSLYTREAGVEKWRYRLRAQAVTREEFVQHWIHSFSLNSMEQVMMSRLNESGRLYFRKDRLELVSSTARRKTRLDPRATRELSAVFGLPSDLILQAHHAVLSRPS